MTFGPIKLLFTAVAALLILGPKRLPNAFRNVSKAFSQLKQASREVSRELKTELDAAAPSGQPGGLGVPPEGLPARPTLRAAPPPRAAATIDEEEELRPGPRP